ncbi:sulfate ABC transporter substrate-binding protein [Cyanobium sp. Morenito 9A2]|uniref:sulfate ABC transporter substrate-binding protein n=1 Tax=Cyanobium sp. Morenito 9A2 TaxID=2823718 RepID=UPI0020CF0B77|nr:sulfate ABC transporter substrate-binding protein [Cyanobium sp. Morenito 9A2]MCP9848493.1 sulfate ABC transporter substrate-binding protein [Cyanobium sp. Morenito 9A2]
MPACPLPPRIHRLGAGLALALLLSACGGPAGTSNGSGQPKQLLLVSYAVTKAAYDRILPAFRADWKARTGEDLEIRTSYGGSGSQTRAIIDGLEADVAGLALGADVNKLQQAGLIEPGWEKELPNDSVITHSTVALLTRPGNPKGIKTWQDLNRKDVEVVSANPRTSGGARWNFLGLWGSITQTGGSDAQAKAFVSAVYGNVKNLPKDAREASDVFLKRNQGDVLLNYENEAILATRTGDLKAPYLVPDPNIRIDGPVAVVDRNVDRRGTRREAEALARYLMSAPAQTIFAEEGFRPVNPGVWSKVKGRFAPVGSLFTVEAFGGWSRVEASFFSAGGLWDQLFDRARR